MDQRTILWVLRLNFTKIIPPVPVFEGYNYKYFAKKNSSHILCAAVCYCITICAMCIALLKSAVTIDNTIETAIAQTVVSTRKFQHEIICIKKIISNSVCICIL
jgi:hypothetical protein